jgi:hypothetical protein
MSKSYDDRRMTFAITTGLPTDVYPNGVRFAVYDLFPTLDVVLDMIVEEVDPTPEDYEIICNNTQLIEATMGLDGEFQWTYVDAEDANS